MACKSFATLLKTSGVAFLLFVLLFAGGGWQSSPGFVGAALREITAVFRDAETQWMVFFCLGIYFTGHLRKLQFPETMNMISLAFVPIRFSENRVSGGAPQSSFLFARGRETASRKGAKAQRLAGGSLLCPARAE